MLNIHNQTRIDKNYLVVGFDPKLGSIYGTDGVRFAVDSNTGNIFRALKSKADMALDLSDSESWAKTDLVENQDLLNSTIGAVRIGVDIVTTDDLKLNISSGYFIAYNSDRMGFERYDIPEVNGATFDYIDKYGNVIDAGVSEIDPINWYDGTNKIELGRTYYSTFQKVYIDIYGNIKVIRGDIEYTSIDKATYRSIAEQIPQIDGLYYIGGYILSKSCATLDSSRCRVVYSSKLGESQVGTPAGTISKLKEPVTDLIALKEIETPETGEMRQDLSTLPSVTMWVFNAEATSGEAPNDGTTGYWNKLEASGKREIVDTNSNTDIEADKDYIVDSSADNVLLNLQEINDDNIGKIFSVTKESADDNTVSIVYDSNTIHTLDTQYQSAEYIITEDNIRILNEYYPESQKNIDYSAVGRIVFQLPQPNKGIYPLDGGTYKDKLLAEHISANSDKFVGFTVDGDNVTTPDWRGHILYGAGGLGLDDTIGQFVEQDLQEHSHTIPTNSGWVYEDNSGSEHVLKRVDGNTGTFGGEYTRVKGYTAQLCILGTTYIRLDENTTLATAVTATFNGATVNGGDTSVTIYEGVYAFMVHVDLDTTESIDSVTNATIMDADKGIILIQQSMGGGDFTVDIVKKTNLDLSLFPLLDNGTERHLFYGEMKSAMDENHLTKFVIPKDGAYPTAVRVFNNRWGVNYGFGSRDDLIVDGGIDLNTINFEFSTWCRVVVEQDSNYYIGNSTTATAQKTLHIGFRDSDTFTVAFWASDVNFDGIYQTDFMDTLHHIFVSHDASTKNTSLFIDNTFIGELTHASNYLSNYDRILSANNGDRKGKVEVCLLRCHTNTDYTKASENCDIIYNYEKELLGI